MNNLMKNIHTHHSRRGILSSGTRCAYDQEIICWPGDFEVL